MEGQEFIIGTIEEKINNELDWIQHLSRTTLINIESYPAVIVEEEPLNFEQLSKERPSSRYENLNLFLILETKNINEIIEGDYKNIKSELNSKSFQLIQLIKESEKTYNGINSITFGQSDNYNATIDSVPVMIMIIPITLKVVLN